jgi:hypothetical protein
MDLLFFVLSTVIMGLFLNKAPSPSLGILKFKFFVLILIKLTLNSCVKKISIKKGRLLFVFYLGRCTVKKF